MKTLHSRALAPFALLAWISSLVAQDGMPPATGPTIGAGLGSSGYAFAVIYTNTVGHPTNVVPGLGVPFNAGGLSTSAFERPWYSFDLQHFAINAIADTLTTDDDVLLLDNALILREGDAATFGLAGELVGTIDADLSVNSLGQVFLGNNANGTAPTTADDYMILYNGVTWVSLAKEGDLIGAAAPGLLGGPNGTWDDGMDAPVLLDSGVAMWRAELVDGLTTGTTNDELFILGNGLALQEGVDVPAGQAGGAVEAWENFDLNDAFATADGANLLIQGDLTGATTGDDVVVLNGVVVVQEGSVLAGSSFVEPVDAEGIVKAWLDRGGNWYVRGNNDVSETDWVYRNGVVVADSAGADEVVPGSGEHWNDADFADCFFAFDGNLAGQYVIGGVTDAPAAINGVIVFDDGAGYRAVVVREGDFADLNGNGMDDDDRYYNTFGNDDVLLLDDGSIVFVATLKNAAGTAVDQGVFRIYPKSASCTLRNGSGVNPVVCSCATLPILGTQWDIAVAAAPNTLATLLFASNSPLPFALPLFGGEALITPPVFDIPGSGTHSLVLPASQQFLGLELYLQGLRLNAVGPTLVLELTNGQDAVLGL